MISFTTSTASVVFASSKKTTVSKLKIWLIAASDLALSRVSAISLSVVPPWT